MMAGRTPDKDKAGALPGAEPRHHHQLAKPQQTSGRFYGIATVAGRGDHLRVT